MACRAYFNGVHVSGLLSMKTFFVKLLSAIFVLAAGLVAEGESPFVHVGAIVGGGFSSMGSRCARLRLHALAASLRQRRDGLRLPAVLGAGR